MLDNSPLYQIILDHIRVQQGMISFAQYMELALYTPKWGYYTNDKQKFGAEGDFITAPLISPLYSKCLAEQCAEIFQNLSESNILEFGAGSGKMAADILLALETKQQLPKHYYIVEISAILRRRQYATLKTYCPHLLSRVKWLSYRHLKNFKFEGVILANEVIDAMPVHRFMLVENELIEICVKENQHQKLELCLREQHKDDTVLHDNLFQLRKGLSELWGTEYWEPGYSSEINLHISPWIKHIAQVLYRGVVLIVDYGYPQSEYYHPQRNMGTLRCHLNHQVHNDPLFAPGLQDITAHVDFTAIAEAAVLHQLEVLGYTNQAAFLLSCGLLNMLNTFSETHDAKALILQNSAVHQLTAPQAMGELFKVIGLGKNYNFALTGFNLNNKVDTL